MVGLSKWNISKWYYWQGQNNLLYLCAAAFPLATLMKIDFFVCFKPHNTSNYASEIFPQFRCIVLASLLNYKCLYGSGWAYFVEGFSSNQTSKTEELKESKLERSQRVVPMNLQFSGASFCIRRVIHRLGPFPRTDHLLSAWPRSWKLQRIFHLLFDSSGEKQEGF